MIDGGAHPLSGIWTSVGVGTEFAFSLRLHGFRVKSGELERYMPSSMDGKTLEQIRDALLERWKRNDRSSELASEFVDTVINTPSAEIIDVAQNLEQMGRDASLAEQERRDLVAVEKALAKMATGSFGVCEDCGEDIPSRRLIVLPQARLCAQCQALEERQTARTRLAASR
jgi:DnaK suppressor protein